MCHVMWLLRLGIVGPARPWWPEYLTAKVVVRHPCSSDVSRAMTGKWDDFAELIMAPAKHPEINPSWSVGIAGPQDEHIHRSCIIQFMMLLILAHPPGSFYMFYCRDSDLRLNDESNVLCLRYYLLISHETSQIYWWSSRYSSLPIVNVSHESNVESLLASLIDFLWPCGLPQMSSPWIRSWFPFVCT